MDSHWEDIAFRLEPLNILTRMCEQLVSTCREKKEYFSKDEFNVIEMVYFLFVIENEYFIALDNPIAYNAFHVIRQAVSLGTCTHSEPIVVLNQFKFIPVLYTKLL